MKASTARFSFVAERVCLDFANTVDWHATDHPGERVQSVTDLLHWSEEAGVLDQACRQMLTRHADAHPDQGEAVLRRSRELREVIYRIFDAVTRDVTPDPADLQRLNAARLEALQHQTLQPDGTGYEWGWTCAPDDLGRVWWPIAVDAATLLTSDLLAKVGQCADDRGCGWLFLDTSKAGRRRWCSMQDCGNRAKAQRYRANTSR
ncbi:CGNR zinc finger domain-containing protein [Deinococcus humi]|uniref:Putative RNA-binding Zn ribbon-like protein n=1 Tax=Deinococcus humi TaxID=662880 RepID=A0A7W8JYN1_9DEIO|nr:ABATE domain-containing protein [Deinococcus humi]MBB5365395.1 putative RNA-binding Zn ribbon-like protein [Deinococcus humi]GGO36047.1 hypothetical protein GCM10008949_39420 [Deinococcus humi]